ncbi:hypothetical protein [Dapis sp. BLCC M126]|uniref:hypothetical protein n=1 Tax=Dapis sp. BLCC M126 TaxID=3400189 RepID=UPI003CEB2169
MTESTLINIVRQRLEDVYTKRLEQTFHIRIYYHNYWITPLLPISYCLFAVIPIFLMSIVTYVTLRM